MTNRQRNLIPALPFCHVRLVAMRPLPAAYPKALTTWGDHIRKRRLDLGLLQKDVAKQFGVSQDAVFNWESHRAIPDVQCIPQIINFLGYCPWKPFDSFGEKLTLWRETLGLSRKHLAIKLNLDKATLLRWETNQRRPSQKYQELLRTFFDKEFTRRNENSQLIKS